ncbi:MAG: dgt [Rickettsiaceae bacterium]|jgi:dGTPase|nr:dgt [Rickettsiaceae bacterium]
MFSNFASKPENSKGRLYQEEDCRYRSIYGRDRDRIINSAAFRRLQYKTQVFVNHEGDHYRTRLTHSLEVAQIARWIASGLGCNKDLAEVVSLAHDLGHTPFGHAGEDALDEKMKEFGGFSHNAHTLKLITKLEHLYLDFDGLNLSWEMLEGVVKHNGAITDDSKIHGYIREYNKKQDLDLSRSPSIEAQISAISDDIAYNNHDIEDGIRAELFSIEELLNLPFVGAKFREVLAKKSNARRELLVSEAKRRMVSDMVLDVISNTKNNIKNHNIDSVEDVRNYNGFLVKFSEEMEIAHQSLKQFLMKNMYRHHKVNRMTASAHKIVGGLFDFFIDRPGCLPENHQVPGSNKTDLAIAISDYIAGMTDRFAIKEYESLN